MKLVLLQFGKQAMFLKLFKKPLYFVHVGLVRVLNFDQDVIQIYYNKDIKLFGNSHVDLTLKVG